MKKKKVNKIKKTTKKAKGKIIKKIISNINEINPKNIINNIVDKLNFDQVKLRDDITCLCIKINNSNH